MTNDRPLAAESAPLMGDVPDNASRRFGTHSGIAPILAILSCILYSFNGELLQFLQVHVPRDDHASVMLNLIFCHMGGLVFAPHFLFYDSPNVKDNSRIDVKSGSLLLALLLMGYNYAWLRSAKHLSAGLTNAVFQTSIAFVYMASVIIFKDKLEGLAALGVVFAIGGSVFASGFQNWTPSNEASLAAGVCLALCASIGMSSYQVSFKHLYGNLKNDPKFLAHIGAWISVWHVIVILPLAGLAHIAGFEQMRFPHGGLAITGTLVSACIASTVNAMYICIVMWGSVMMLPCASALSVPFTLALDVFLHHVLPTRLEIVGHIMVVLSVPMIIGLHKSVSSARWSKLPDRESPAELSPSEPLLRGCTPLR